jgi:FlaA1/EpsC-like NDP-sugar epimerase
MTEEERGVGERREAATRRRRIIIFGVLFAAGLGLGFYTGVTDHERAFLSQDGKLSPFLAIFTCVIFVAAVVIGPLLLRNSVDEMHRHSDYKAISIGAAVYAIVYPLWFLLWKGDLVREPIHWVLFSLFMLTLGAARLYLRFR